MSEIYTPPGLPGIDHTYTMFTDGDPAVAATWRVSSDKLANNIKGVHNAVTDEATTRAAADTVLTDELLATQTAVNASLSTLQGIAHSCVTTLRTSSATWTKPTNLIAVQFVVVGAGGGGGGKSTVSGRAQGGGGGGGAKVVYMERGLLLPATLGIVVGTGGAGGAAGVWGSNGGDSYLTDAGNPICLAQGGRGGASDATGSTNSTGGNGGGGTLTPGDASLGAGSNAATQIGAGGSAGRYAASAGYVGGHANCRGGASAAVNTAGFGGQGYGAGGGGAATSAHPGAGGSGGGGWILSSSQQSQNGTTDGTAGAGGKGCVLIIEWIAL